MKKYTEIMDLKTQYNELSIFAKLMHCFNCSKSQQYFCIYRQVYSKMYTKRQSNKNDQNNLEKE